MIGHNRPIKAASFAVQAWAATLVALCAAVGASAEIDVRLRFVWGSGAQAPQVWTGEISAAGAAVSQLQPLGIEADEVAALRLADNRVVVAPLVPRVFDGCDLTIRGDDQTPVAIRLHNVSAAEPKEVSIPLGELARGEYRAPLDELGGYLLVNRAPGDRLRVTIDREHLVFSPGESLKLAVAPHLEAPPASPLSLEARVMRVDGGAVVWETRLPYEPTKPAPLALELAAPAAEGAYRLSLALRAPSGLTSKLTPWQQPAAAAARDVEFVVIDPAARLPRITADADVVQSIDPANPKWWKRVPDWTQLDRLPGLSAPRSLGNVKPAPRAGGGPFVELPAPTPGQDPAWQAYALAVREVGAPHVVEIDLPADARQQLAVSVIEPDAAGRVQAFGREAGVYVDDVAAPAADGQLATIRHRVTFWPRSASPVLLIANESPSRPAQYGAIRVLRRRTEEAAADGKATAAVAQQVAPSTSGDARLVAAYISVPRLARCLGAAEEHDAQSTLSVEGWGTFLDAARRLAQELKAGGYNAAIVSIAADGSSLAPIAALGGAPRYDAGLLAASGADPIRKDVLEAMLRVFDREGLRFIPAVEPATPLPRLEALLAAGGATAAGVACVGHDGRTWNERFPGQAVGPRYNILDARVQGAVSEVADQLVARYGDHPSLAGVAVQVTGRSYAVLPGLAWGLDDATTSRFAAAAKIELPAAGPEQRAARVGVLLGAEKDRWSAWRQAELTRFYTELAQRVAGAEGRRQLVLCTENLFAGAEASHRLRQAVNGGVPVDSVAAELGLDLAALAAAPGVQLLRPRRLASDEALEARAVDWQINNSAELSRAWANQPRCGELFYFGARRLRLPSFDAQSPFGADRTYLSMIVPGFPNGVAARRPLAAALAARDFFAWVEGAELLPLVDDAESARLRRLFQELPAGDAEVRVERRQPATLRVYRTPTATTLCLVNESPWSAEVDLSVDFNEPASWRELGVDVPPVQGTPSSRGGAWRLTLPPYGVAARRYESRSLRVGELRVVPSKDAAPELAARIRQIDERVRGLDVERPYPQLQNPDFERVGADGLMLGWTPRIGQTGAVAIDEAAAVSGARALHLTSGDAVGVAAQSHRFALPATGQLTVRARIKATDLADDAAFYVWVEYDSGGALLRKPLRVDARQLGAAWATVEVAFDELPLASTGQMRVQFHLAGRGEAWVDGVELFDLRFPDAQRMELVRGLYAAKTALDAGQLVECQRRLDGYWLRYVVDAVPADSTAGGDLLPPDVRVAEAPKDAPPPAPESDQAPGLGGRLRQWTPPIFRR
jgi:hypothetical protein